MRNLTAQERDQHPRLAECRNTVESALKLTRTHAAAICNRMDHKHVEAVLAAGGDEGKVRAAVEKVDAPEPEPVADKEPPKLEQSSKRK